MDRSDLGTREQILRLVVIRGPITPSELAKILVLTPAAVRRHILTLVADGYIKNYEVSANGNAKRGRPSKRYVATANGQSQLNEAYSDLARQALEFVRENLGSMGVEEFVNRRISTFENQYGEIIEAAGDNPVDRVAALARALDRDGYMTTLRRGFPLGMTVQLCQGHCPVQSVAESFPEICDAETQAFSRLLGVPIQRLATLAGGEHVCTTNIPIGNPTLRKEK